MYAFGSGLTYGDVQVKEVAFADEMSEDGNVKIAVRIKNEGSFATKDVVQVYIKNHGTAYAPPHPVLCGFQNVDVKAGEEKTITLEIPERAFCVVNEDGKYVKDSDSYTLYVGMSGVDERSKKLEGNR